MPGSRDVHEVVNVESIFSALVYFLCIEESCLLAGDEVIYTIVEEGEPSLSIQRVRCEVNRAT
jgi:hypothetical protein